jgi:hypothetical protein
MRPGKPLILAVPLAALAISGCGGGGGGDTTAAPVTTETTPTLSKEDLISQGDSICREVNAAVGTIGANDSETSSEAIQVADIYAGMVDNLKGLGEPDAEAEAGYAEFIEAAEQLSAAEGEAKLADEREDEAGLEAAEANAATALSDFQSAAASYGFEDCSEGPSAPSITPGPGTEAPSEGGEEVAPEEEIVPEEEAAPEVEEEVAPEGGGAGAEVAPEEGGGTEAGGGSGGIGPG